MRIYAVTTDYRFNLKPVNSEQWSPWFKQVSCSVAKSVWLFATPWWTAACQASLASAVSGSLLVLCPLSQWCYLTVSSHWQVASLPLSYKESPSINTILAKPGENKYEKNYLKPKITPLVTLFWGKFIGTSNHNSLWILYKIYICIKLSLKTAMHCSILQKVPCIAYELNNQFSFSWKLNFTFHEAILLSNFKQVLSFH